MKNLTNCSTINLFCLLLLTLTGVRTCQAQAARPTQPGKIEFSLVMSDFQAPGTRRTDTLGTLVRDAVAEAMKQGRKEYHIIERAEMTDAVKALGLQFPTTALQPTEFSADEWLRIGREMKASALVTGEVRSLQDRKKGTRVTVAFVVRDLKDDETLDGGSMTLTVEPRARETDDAALRRTAVAAAQEAVQQMLQRPAVITTVLSVRGDIIVVAAGQRDGLKPGDELNVFRYTTGGYIRSGKIRITHTEGTHADAQIVTNLGIAPEDVARKAYRPDSKKQ